MSRYILKYNDKFSLYKGDRIADYELKLIRIGGCFNQVSPSSACEYRYVYFATTLMTTTASTVGIKIPITKQPGSYDIWDYYPNTELIIQDRSVVADAPGPFTSPISGFTRNFWNVNNDDDFIYIYTSNAGQKSALNTTTEYWFGITLKAFAFTLQSPDEIYFTVRKVSESINFIRASAFTNYNLYSGINIYDYNA